MLLEKGDAFEVSHANWLRAKLPHYEAIWADFIGNDGRAHPLPIPGLDDDKEARRRRFYQAHYTIAQRCLSIDESMQRGAETLGAVGDADDVGKEFDLLFEFMSKIGSVRDLFKAMDTALKLNGKASDPLQEFYDMRSHVMHGPLMPYLVDDGLLKIPPMAKRNKGANEWESKSLWEEVDPSSFVYAAEFCTKTGEAFFNVVNTLHAKVRAGAYAFFDGKKVDWTQWKENEPTPRPNSFVPIQSLTVCSTSVVSIFGYRLPGSGEQGH